LICIKEDGLISYGPEIVETRRSAAFVDQLEGCQSGGSSHWTTHSLRTC